MTESSQVAATRAFVGVSYLLGARGAELAAREPLHPVADRLARELASSEQLIRARAIAKAVLDVSRDLDARRLG